MEIKKIVTYHQNFGGGCTYPHTMTLKNNGVTKWTYTANSAVGKVTHSVSITIKVGDNITLSSPRCVNCIGGSGQRDEVFIPSGVEISYGAPPYNFGDVYSGYTINFTIAAIAGRPDASPTYLETLDKMDQWSSAQYIPERNQLNL